MSRATKPSMGGIIKITGSVNENLMESNVIRERVVIVAASEG